MSGGIEFHSSDNVMSRAQKIWQILGYPNDSMTTIPAIAGVLAMYRELDDVARKNAKRAALDRAEAALREGEE